MCSRLDVGPETRCAEATAFGNAGPHAPTGVKHTANALRPPCVPLSHSLLRATQGDSERMGSPLGSPLHNGTASPLRSRSRAGSYASSPGERRPTRPTDSTSYPFFLISLLI